MFVHQPVQLYVFSFFFSFYFLYFLFFFLSERSVKVKTHPPWRDGLLDGWLLALVFLGVDAIKMT